MAQPDHTRSEVDSSLADSLVVTGWKILIWVQSGGSSINVAPHQLRQALGFEQWVLDKEDLQSLRDAASNLQQGEVEDHSLPLPPKNGEPGEVAADHDPYLPLVVPTDLDESSRSTKRPKPDTPLQLEPRSLSQQQTIQHQRQQKYNSYDKRTSISKQSPTHKTINPQQGNFGPDSLQPLGTSLRRARSRAASTRTSITLH